MWYLCWVSFKLQVHYNKDHHERVDLVITASMNVYHTKTKYSNSNENMLFWRITDKTIWNSSFQLTPLYLSNFFMTPLFVWILKIKPPHLIWGVGGMLATGWPLLLEIPGNLWNAIWVLQKWKTPRKLLEKRSWMYVLPKCSSFINAKLTHTVIKS